MTRKHSLTAVEEWVKKVAKRMSRFISPNSSESPSDSKLGPINSTPSAHNSGPGSGAGREGNTEPDSNNQEPTAPFRSARPALPRVPDMLCDAVDPGHGGKISPILASAPSTSPFVCPTLAISGNTAEGKQKVHAALDASGSNIAGFLVDEHTSFPPPLDSNSASPQDLVTSFNNAMSNIPGLPQLSALSPSVHHPEIEGEQQTSQNAHPLDSMSPIATTGDTLDSGIGGSLTMPNSLSADCQAQDFNLKSTAKDVLEVAWTGMKMLLKKVESCLEGTLARPPVAAINALIDITNTVGDNKDNIEEFIIQTTKRLLAVDEAIDQGVPDSGKSRTTAFAEILRNEIHKIDEMSEKGTFRRILENDADKNAISASFKRVDEAMKTFQLDIAWTTERKMDDIHSEIELAKLDRLLAHKAIYDADLGGRASVTREPCTAGTREEILQDIIAWVDDTSADSPPVFWLTGQAGSGKTTIAYTVTQYFDELEETEHTGQRTLLAASFHCSRQFDETRRQIHIIPTIVYQLARKSRSYAKALHAAKKLDSVDKLTKQMEDLLAGPWQQSESQRHKELPPYLIVVDALDEIEADGGSMFLQSLLETINQRRLQGLKFLVTSRPDPRVAKLCETFSSEAVYRLQDVPIERVELDIIKFLKIKLSNFTDNAELEAMAVLADGLFISAATIVRYLTPDPSIELEEQRELLRKLRDGKTFAANGVLLIDELYQQILRDAFSGFTGDLFKSRRSILHTFLCTIERTTTSVAAALLSKPDAIADAVLKKLHAVLYSKDGQVFWYHASFPDFIFSETRSTFEFDGRKFSMSCNVARHHALLTESCFDIMRKSLRFNIGDIPSSFLLDAEDAKLKQRVDTNIKPFLIYASRHWSHHLAQTNQKNGEDLGSCITDFLRIRILFWIEAMNLLGFSSHCSTMLQYAREWILKNTNRESELPNNLAEAANFATYFATNLPALSTPHLYISALATWSTGSAISQQWKETFPDVPTFIHRQADVPLMTIPTGTFAAFSPDGTCIVSGTGRKDYSVRVWDVSTAAELKVLNGHKDIVWCVAFSLDGTRIVSGSKDTSVRVWDVSTAGELKVLHGHTKGVRSIAFSPDGAHIVSGSEDTSVRVWDVSTGAELKVLDGHTRIVYSVAFSLDGTRIVSGSKDRSVRVWDASTAAELKVLHGHTMGVRSIAFSPDGAHIVSGSDDTSVRVWDVSTGAELKVLDGHTMIVYSVAFSPDGTRIVSGSLDTSVRVWDTSTGTELRVLDGYTEYINSVAYSPDGTRIVSGSCQTPVRIWDASTGAKAKVKVHHGHKDNVKSVAFSTDGTRIVSGSDDKSVRVWDASTGAELKVLYGHTQGVNSIAFSPDGAHIVSGSKDMSVRVWDVSTGAELKVLDGHTESVLSVGFSPDGTRIVSGSLDMSVRVWDASTGAELMALNSHTIYINSVAYSRGGTHFVSSSMDKSVRVWNLSRQEDTVCSVAFSPDGTCIVSGLLDKTVQVRDTSTGAELKVLNGHKDISRSVTFSPDGTRIVSGSNDKSVRVWDVPTGVELMVLNGHSNCVNCVAYSSDGTRIVSGSWDKSGRVWDASAGAELVVLNGHTSCVNAVAFSPDGTRIVSGSLDMSVRVWNALTGAELMVLNGHTEYINSVAYSPGGTHIVSSSKDKSVRVWDASTGADLRVLNGHTEGVNSVAFSPDGTLIVSGSWDRSVRVWDVLTGAELKVYIGHQDAVKSVAFSTDGFRIISGSKDKSVRAWDARKDTVNTVNVAFSTNGSHIVSGSLDQPVWMRDVPTGAQLKVNSYRVFPVAFSPDGTPIVSGSQDTSVQLWDASTGAELKVLKGHTESVNSVAYSPGGTHIVSSSKDKSVRVWDASTGAELMVLGHSNELMVLNGYTRLLNSVAYSPGGTHIVSSSDHTSMRVWDTTTGAELRVLNGHTKGVNSVAFSPDGTRIVSGSKDMSVRVWDVSTSLIDSSDVAAQDEESARLSIVSHKYPAWTTDPNQWVFSVRGGYRLMWVPETVYPFSIITISRHGSTSINFRDCKIGRDWANCYAHS